MVQFKVTKTKQFNPELADCNGSFFKTYCSYSRVRNINAKCQNSLRVNWERMKVWTRLNFIIVFILLGAKDAINPIKISKSSIFRQRFNTKKSKAKEK